MKTYIFFLLASLLITFLLLSCNEHSVTSSSDQSLTPLNKKTGEPLDSLFIEPNALPCGDKTTAGGWVFDHYQSMQGKFLGIWTSLKTPTELYKKYGFNQLFIGDKQSALQAVFKADSLMGAINYSPSSVDQYGYIKYYHLDEPIENGVYPDNVRWIAQYIHTSQPNSLMMMSSFRETSTWTIFPNGLNGTYAYFYRDQIMNQASNTRIMCDKYVGWFNEPIDQRPYWSDFKNAYTSKNISNWISLDKDHDDSQYEDLLGHANNLGLNNLWVYGAGSGNGGYIGEFCEAAWKKGWLRKFERKIDYIIWKCTLPNPCDCELSDPEVWYIYKIVWTNQYRELFP